MHSLAIVAAIAATVFATLIPQTSMAVDTAPTAQTIESKVSATTQAPASIVNFPIDINPEEAVKSPSVADPQTATNVGKILTSISADIMKQFSDNITKTNALNPFLINLRQRVGPSAVITVRYDSDPRLFCLSDAQSILGPIPRNAELAVVAYYEAIDKDHPDRAAILSDLEKACQEKNQLRGIEPVYNAELLVRDDTKWVQALSTTEGLDGVWINRALIEKTSMRFKLNGQPLSTQILTRPGDTDVLDGYLFGSGAIATYRFEAVPVHEGCRIDTINPPFMSMILGQPEFDKTRQISVGITVGAPKIYDTFTLRQMLNATATQLASISGFSQAQIFSQLGTFQGITRDTSFLAAQITTTPTPTVTSVNSAGLTGSNTNSSSNVLNSGGTSSITTMQCPSGTVPSINSGAVQSCTAPILNGATSATPTILGAGPLGGNTAQESTGTGSGSLQSTVNNGTTLNNSQNGQTTITSGGYAGTLPTTPGASPIAAPNNVGVSAADSLVEQVQLNSQITNLRLMLQGALSDQYLTRNSQAVAARAQTTMGFSVSLDPPRQYKHAVAEVRVVVVSPRRAGEVSIVNLLPASKTYNVAKVTSHQSAFGAGVVVDTINVGASTGRSKDRLYLAKDTDTVALEYPDKSSSSLNRPFPQYVADLGREIERWLELGACSDDMPEPHGQDVKVFGWQFRPVLGADYVQAGQRQVFAQLALPTAVTQAYAPYVYVQTRWRSYNEKKQAVGAAFTGSCTSVRLKDAITMQNPIQVDDVQTTDIGGGTLQMHVKGSFFSPGLSALIGSSALPVFTTDGQSLDLFVNAATLMQSGPVKLIQEDGTVVPLGIGLLDDKTKQCSINDVKVVPVPLPDGTSRVLVDFNYGQTYQSDIGLDGAPDPMIMFGGQVFGLQSAPLLRRGTAKDICGPQTANQPIECHFDIIAATDALRGAQTYVVRDLRWGNFAASGNLEFEPAFTAIKSALPPPKDKDKPKPKKTIYSISGLSFNRITNKVCANPLPTPIEDANCVELFDGDALMSKIKTKISFASPTTAVLTAEEPLKTTAVRVLWHGHATQPVEWDLTLPKLPTESIAASPALLSVGDSRMVTFSGGEDLATATALADPNLKFDGGNGSILLAGVFDKTKSTLKVLIPTAVTQKPGYKEITAMLTVPSQKTPKAVQLPIQVVQGITTLTAN